MAVEISQMPPNPRRSRPMPLVDVATLAPTQRLLQVAASLLAWWNAKSCRGFNLTDLWTVGAIARDMLATAAFIATLREYPAGYGLGPQFEQLVNLWRPALAGTGDG